MLRIGLLGPFRVEVDGRPVPAGAWSRRDPAALVRLLALQRDRRLHREQVVDRLWPDLAVADAAPRLHKAAHYARRALGRPDAVVLRHDVVSLTPGAPVAVDAEEFEDAAAAALAEGSPAGCYVQGRMVRATTEEQRREHRLQVELARLGWGRDQPAFRQVFTSQFMPGGSRELWDSFNELQRATTSAENAARVLEVAGSIDVAAEAARVRAPTLVLHARGDQRPPFEQGRLAAALIPGSRFVALDSRNHVLLADEPAWPVFVREVEAFLAEPGP